MTIYQVFTSTNQLLGVHQSPSVALKHALVYQHTTGQSAYVEQTDTDHYQDADDLADWTQQEKEQ